MINDLNGLIQKWSQLPKREIMPRPHGSKGVPNITFNEKHGSQTEEIRIAEFNKSFTYRSTIFRCTICQTNRKYGEHGKPERNEALIICEGNCRGKHTWHSFVGIHGYGGFYGDSKDYAGISDNT